MNREEQFLKYLDGELSPKEMNEVEQLLSSDSISLQEMEEVRMKREQARSVLNMLNPESVDHSLPFRAPEKTRHPWRGFVRYAAAAIIILGLMIAAWLVLLPLSDSMDGENTTAFTETEQFNNELDFYISPNRCWNDRKLSIIIIEIK